MRRRATAVIAALLSVFLLTSCGNPKEFTDSEKLSAKQTRNADISVTFNYADGAHDPPTDYGNYINGVTEFSLSQFRALYKENSGSFMFSPASSALQLSLLANAAGDTRQEILLALGGTLTQDGLNACSSYFKSRLESVSRIGQKEAPKEQIKLDGAMLIDSSIDVKASFLQSTKDYYGFDVFRYDFNGENSADKLDAYLKPYTSDSGIDVSKSGTLDTLCAVSVNDGWLEGYKDSNAFSGSFDGAQGKRNEVYLCSDESRMSSEKAEGILKYTSKNPLKIVLITPKDGKALDEYVGNLDGTELNALLGSIDITKKSAAAFPEFTIGTDGKAKAMSKSLSQAGLYSLFSDKSSFSSLSYGKGATLGEMYDIPQEFSLTRAGINKGASGGKAAAVLKSEKDTLVFDRPFIFMLLDNESNLPVYIGVYR